MEPARGYPAGGLHLHHHDQHQYMMSRGSSSSQSSPYSLHQFYQEQPSGIGPPQAAAGGFSVNSYKDDYSGRGDDQEQATSAEDYRAAAATTTTTTSIGSCSPYQQHQQPDSVISLSQHQYQSPLAAGASSPWHREVSEDVLILEGPAQPQLEQPSQYGCY